MKIIPTTNSNVIIECGSFLKSRFGDFFLCPQPLQMLGGYFILGHDHFLPHYFQLFIHKSFDAMCFEILVSLNKP